MPRYQFRIPKGESLDEVLNSIVEEAWSAIEPHFDLRRLQPDDCEDFRSCVKEGLIPYLCAYDMCGLAPECSDEIEGAPMMDHEDRIFHLVVPDTFSELVSGLSFAAFYSIKHAVKASQQESIREGLELAFRHGVSQNLYYNPACGRIDLCNVSRAIDLEVG